MVGLTLYPLRSMQKFLLLLWSFGLDAIVPNYPSVGAGWEYLQGDRRVCTDLEEQNLEEQNLYGFGGADLSCCSALEEVIPVLLCVCSALTDLEVLTKKAVHAALSTTYRHPPLMRQKRSKIAHLRSGSCLARV